MEEIIYQKSYQEYKQELDGVLQQTAEGFVRIGYLLKVARDTNILAESGYSSVVEFAQAEYNIDKTQVSRFIHINDKFAEGGYSDRLEEKYQGFGYAKLTLMLQLPDEINEELSPKFSKTEIQAIKEEVDAEQQISDIELIIEGEKIEQRTMESMLDKAINQLLEDEPELYEVLHKAEITGASDPEDVKPILAPAGEKIYSLRIRGKGRVMLSLKDTEETVTVTPLRAPEEKESFTWQQVLNSIGGNMIFGVSFQESYKMIYDKDFPKVEIAPVQQKPTKISTDIQKPAKRKDSKVNKAKVEPKKVATPEKSDKIAPVQQSEQAQLNDFDATIPATDPQEAAEPDSEMAENAINTPCDEEIPGQDTILNHPEYLPEEMTEVILPENAIKTECEENLDSPAAGAEEKMVLTPEQTEESWQRIIDSLGKVHLFADMHSAEDVIQGKVPREEIKEAYDQMIDVAAALEKILMSTGQGILRYE